MNSILRYLVICFTLASFQLVAQSMSKEVLTGDWICKEVLYNEKNDLPVEAKEQMDLVKKGFVNSQFIFGADGIFKLVLAPNAPAIMKELYFINNKKWFYYPDKHKIQIGTTRENLMQITVVQKSGVTIFSLYETPLSLRMENVDYSKKN